MVRDLRLRRRGIDYDNDGFQDLYFVNGAPGTPNALYHNNHDGTFTDVTAQGGRRRRRRPDLQDRRRGRRHRQRRLPRSLRHRGRPEPPVPEQRRRHVQRHHRRRPASPAAPAEWSTSTGFLDYDHDGDLDLYVANYVDFRARREPVLRLPARRATACTAIRRCSTAWRIGCSGTTATARSPTCRRRPGSPTPRARGSASRSATTTATATPTSTSPTTWSAISSTATTATARSPTSPTAPAWGSI